MQHLINFRIDFFSSLVVDDLTFTQNDFSYIFVAIINKNINCSVHLLSRKIALFIFFVKTQYVMCSVLRGNCEKYF